MAMSTDTLVYLDYNATTPVAQEVIESMTLCSTTGWANPSSGYEHGRQAKRLLEEARGHVAAMIGAKSQDIIFTSGGTEANNLVVFGILKYYEDWSKNQEAVPTSKPHIITTNVEHDATLLPIKHLQLQGKIDATLVPVSKQGIVSKDDILSHIRPNTCLITIMLANNESGVIMPVAEIGRQLKSLNKHRFTDKQIKILYHTDAAQAIGKIEVDVDQLLVDYLTVVGHKFYGPRGGCLYARDPPSGTPVYPMLFGGGQERGLRPGTENTAVCVGLGRAAQLVTDNLEKYNQHFQQMREFLELQLKAKFGEEIVINFRSDGLAVLPNTCSVSFRDERLHGAKILRGCRHLEASVGAACHDSNMPSGILMASGLPVDMARNTIRLSVGRETSPADIDTAVTDLSCSCNMIMNCK